MFAFLPSFTRRALALACLVAALTWIGQVAGEGAPAGTSAAKRALSASGPDEDALPSGDFPRGPELLVQDAELVFGPADRGFDGAGFVADHRDALPSDPELATVLERTSLQHSISPRLLLALLSIIATPSGRTTEQHLQQMAAWLADGYYGLKYRGERTVQFADGSKTGAEVQGGAGHVAVARLLARSAAPTEWAAWRARFAERYQDWFGPADWLPAPLPSGLHQPPLLLPWLAEQRWYFTGGPHGAWGIASAWGAVDFAPPSKVGCGVAPEWVLAAAPGRVVHADQGLVLQDLDGDGDPRTGWVLAYLHIATRDRVVEGTVLDAATPIGHPSCEGGVADGAHVHLARRFNGEWLPAAEGPAPLDLSGWLFQSLGGEYDGSMSHPTLGERMAVTSRRGGDAGLVSDNGPERRAQLAPLWAAAGVVGAAAPTGTSTHAGGSTTLDTLTEAAAVGDPVDPDNSGNNGAIAAHTAPGSAAPSTGASTGPSLRLRLALAGRTSAAVPITVRISQEGRQLVRVATALDDDGLSPVLALPPGTQGAVDITVGAPGFVPISAFGVAVGDADVSVDLSGGGQVKARPGDLDGDARVGSSDITAWWTARREGLGAADLTGDGRADFRDLWQVMGSLAGR